MKLRTYKLYAGMTGEFEILRTDADYHTVIGYIQAAENEMLPDNDPVKFFAIQGFSAEFIACQYDDDFQDPIDIEIDIYNY